MSEKQTTYKNVAGFRCLRNIRRQTNDLYLVHCGIQQCPPGYTYNHKIPNEYHLHFVLSAWRTRRSASPALSLSPERYVPTGVQNKMARGREVHLARSKISKFRTSARSHNIQPDSTFTINIHNTNTQ